MNQRRVHHPATPPRMRPLSQAVGVALWCMSASPQAQAQAAGTLLPSQTLPVLRSVVSGQAIVRNAVPTANGQLLTIDQQSSRAVIDWRSFNIGSGSEVRFVQPDAAAVALNRIFSADPSIIQGKLSANGQVYLINQNGILFDRGAQVNVNTLLASTLNLSSDTFNKGLTSGATSTPALQGAYAVAGDGSSDASLPARGAIGIGAHGPAGAAAPSINAAATGSILMFAPVIDNRSGVIQAPDGQVILAAGSKVYLTDASPDLLALRGMVVEVSAENGPVDLTSLVRNQGSISAERGNVTLAALAVNQEGRVSASTAVLYNGSVWLKANSVKQLNGVLTPDRSGAVTIGAGAVVETPIDRNDKTTIAESQSFASIKPADDKRPSIRIDGQTIVNQGRIEAVGGRVELSAIDALEPAAARIYLAEGSRLSAAGNWADLAYDGNLLSFKVTSNELKDAPLQKDSLLKGQTVTVDLRKGSSLLDLAGYQDGRQRSVSEKATSGGEVSLNSTGEVIQRLGATVDVSGGGYRYAAGATRTTRLLGADGTVYDITTAPKDRPYVAVLDSFTKTYPRWGQTKVWSGLNQLEATQEQAYLEGKPGGQMRISAKGAVVLDGRLAGGSSIGGYQLVNAPAGGALTLGTDVTDVANTVPLANVRFNALARDNLGSAFGPGSVLGAAAANELRLGADTLLATPSTNETLAVGALGFSRIELNAAGAITLPSEVSLVAPIGSTLVLRGQALDIAGDIHAPGGSLQLQAFKLASSNASTAAQQITLRPGASLSTAGMWLNNASTDGASLGPLLPTAVGGVAAVNGGSVRLTAPNVELRAGAVLDVSGGGRINSSKVLSGGNAGALNISADPGLGNPGTSRLDAELRAYAIGNGGSLTLTLGELQIGQRNPNLAGTVIGAEAFDRGGFQRFDVAGTRGLTLTTGTEIRPQLQSWQVDGVAAATLPSGADLASIARPVRLPAEQARPLSVSLRASGSNAPGTLTVEPGSTIDVGVAGNINLVANAGIELQGRLSAPAGKVTLSLNSPLDAEGARLHLAPAARIEAGAAFVAKPNERGLRQGSLLAGGVVTLDARNASIDIDAGARIAVDGMARTLDLAAAPGSADTVATQLAEAAGTVLLRAQDGARIAGTLSGQAADARSAGGSFALELTNRESINLAANTAQPRRIVLTQAPATEPAPAGFKDATLAANTLASAGFDKLRLQAENQIELRELDLLNFARGVRLDSPELRVNASQPVLISGSTVVLANSFGRRPAEGGALDPTSPSVAVATTAGTGVLQVQAHTIDVLGDVTLGGVLRSTLSARDDLRLSGRAVGNANQAGGAVLTGSLVSSGDIVLNAAQVYPTTAASFTVAVQQRSADGASTPQAGGRVTVQANGREGGEVLSAAGKLTLRADEVVQAGVLKAPLGEINFEAGKAVDLAAGSVTSVSALGQTIPYGGTEAGVSWLYATTNATTNVNDLKTPPAKRITLSAPSVLQRSGATLDVAGGGELLATEFVKGSGGSTDVLLQDNSFAILPKARLAAMPVDGHIAALKDLGTGLLSQRGDTTVYDSLHIGTGADVPEGDYVLLPGRYALLPGAYLVQLQTASAYSQLPAGSKRQLPNGQTVVTGYRTVAGTAMRESRTVGVIVRPGSEAKTESDYNLTGSDFFAALASRQRRENPQLPADAGALQIVAGRQLALDGSIVTAAAATAGNANARGAEIDISAERLAVVERIGQPGIGSQYLQLEAASLTRIQGSILLGGVRSNDNGQQRLTAGAAEVLIANSAAQPLNAPELMVVAKDSIRVLAGSVVSGQAGAQAAEVAPRTIAADAGGALLRVAAAGPVRIDRGASPDTSRGVIDVQAGATLKASGALSLDATRTTRSEGELQLAAGASASLAAGSIRLGDRAADAGLANDGLHLRNARLATLSQLAALELKSYGGIEVLPGAQIGSAGLKKLTLDSAVIQGVPGASEAVDHSARIDAGELTLVNSVGGHAPARVGTLALQINTERVVSAAGDRAFSGFASVAIASGEDIVADGQGQLRVGGALSLRSARVVANAGANQTWRAAQDDGVTPSVYHPITMSASGGAAPGSAAPADALGARLAIEGKSIDTSARITLKAGSLTLAALGSDGSDSLRLRDGAVIDVGGSARSFNGAVALADAGSVTLQSAAGRLQLDANAVVRLDADVAGGKAGQLRVAAQGVQLDGQLSAKAAADGASGRFSLDVATAPELAALNARLDAGEFFESRELRVRQGDVNVANGQTVKARHISIAADNGRVEVAGTLDASGTQGGGSVALYAQNGLRLGASALIDASGRGSDNAAGAAASNGGRVALDTRGGSLVFDAGAKIDVRAGEKGDAGSVRFTAPRGTDNASVAAELRGTVLSQRRAGDAPATVALEARRIYSAMDGADIDTYARDQSAFVQSVDAAAVLRDLKGDGAAAAAQAVLRPAIELRSAGDFALATAWDLTGADWLAAAGPQKAAAGTLTLRAAGNLSLASALGLPDDNLALLNTWNLRLVAGADLAAAHAMATVSPQRLAAGKGNVLLDGDNAKLRTGTGSIDIAAARNFRIDSDKAVVYTSGLAAAPNPASTADNPNPAAGVNGPWARAGGDIRISAGEDAVGASDQWINDWLRRPRGTLNDSGLSGWWAYRPNFRQNIATFGGGDIHISAGRDIDQLSAMSASSGRVSAAAGQPKLEVQGGGNLVLQAGRDIKGGEYLVARGLGTINAAGAVGQETPTQLYLMGESDDASRRQASLRISAGGSVALQSVDNPTALGITASHASGGGNINNFSPRGSAASYYYSYADNSRVDITSFAGDVLLGSKPRVKASLSGSTLDENIIAGAASAGSAYAPSLQVQAFAGAIKPLPTGNGDALTLFPSSQGGLRLLASSDIDGLNLTVSDKAPVTVPAWDRVAKGDAVSSGVPVVAGLSDPRIVARTPGAGYVFDVQSAQGDIRASDLTLPGRARVRAGRDIVGGTFTLQNLEASDVSVVQADRGDLRPGGGGINIAGPGRLLVQAGRDADVQTQVLASGNDRNSSLPSGQSARLTVIAGVTGDVDLRKLDAAYAELIEAGKAQNNERAKVAVKAFFGDAKIQAGDINSYLGSLQTTGGSDIDLLAPKGNITVGLTTPGSITIGAVTNAGGAIRSVLDGSFNINQGKVVTAQSGDILIYTTSGNIDAGRGAKTSVTTPAPRRVPIIVDGSLVGYRYELASGVAGSGIQTVTSDPDGPGPRTAAKAGSVYLFAPSGFVDAGEAGIVSGADIIIAAQVVLNASNISAQGASVGVPVAVAGSLASSLASSGATTTGSGKAAEDAAGAAGNAARAAAAAGSLAKPSILTVEVMGFGDKNCKESQKDCFAK